MKLAEYEDRQIALICCSFGDNESLVMTAGLEF